MITIIVIIVIIIIIIITAIIITIMILIIKKIFINNEWWADPGLGLKKVLWLWTKFQTWMAQTTIYHEYVYCERDPSRGFVQYLSSLLDYLLDNNCKYFISLNYGFEYMKNAESTNVPFTIFRTRIPKGKLRTLIWKLL